MPSAARTAKDKEKAAQQQAAAKTESPLPPPPPDDAPPPEDQESEGEGEATQQEQAPPAAPPADTAAAEAALQGQAQDQESALGSLADGDEEDAEASEGESFADDPRDNDWHQAVEAARKGAARLAAFETTHPDAISQQFVEPIRQLGALIGFLVEELYPAEVMSGRAARIAAKATGGADESE